MQNQLFFTTILFLSFSIANLHTTNAQNVAINSDGSTPQNSAMLDIKNANKGLLVPRVALTGANDVATIVSPATSLLIYNTAVAGTSPNDVTPGYYYWNSAAWVKLIAVDPGSGVWMYKGNAGTVDGTSFIGTTDDAPFNIRVNNQKAGRVDSTSQNSFWGYRAGDKTVSSNNVATGYKALFLNSNGSSNTSIGANALFNNIASRNTATGSFALYGNTTGSQNTAHGDEALISNTSGNYNTALGGFALRTNNTGYSNTATGLNALYSNTAGYRNTATGVNALYSNTSGYRNTASGYNALYSNTIGFWNTAIGDSALYSNTSGYRNAAYGSFALYYNTTGINNTAIGNNALSYNATGSYNTAVGVDAGMIGGVGGLLSNITAIGYSATVNASNKIRFGNSSVTSIEGQVAYSYPSDARFKYNIHEDVPGLSFIKKLSPVTYYFDEQKFDSFVKTGILNDKAVPAVAYTQKQLHTGFLAQDVENIAKELGYDFDGVHAPANGRDNYSIAYSQFIMPLVKGMQEQQQMIDDQNKKISSQDEQIKRLNEKLETLIKAVSVLPTK